MLTWLPVMAIAFGSLIFAACNLFYLPIGFPQFVMVCGALYLSVLLADLAVLSIRLVRIERELERETRVLAGSRC